MVIADYFPLAFLFQCDHSELAIAANKKNVDQHVVYLGWSLGEEKNEVASVDIQRDNWLPKIGLQGDQLYTYLIVKKKLYTYLIVLF